MALAEILAHKRIDVAARKAAAPLSEWQHTLVPSDRALRTDQTAFILECKQASPSEGTLRTDFDPVRLASSYAPFATAISVLTDTPYFGGSFEHLRRVRHAVHVPVLCKDFVVDPYQVYEARRYGADMVLLMLSVLDDDTWRQCHQVATELGLQVLTEVHDEAELHRAVALPAAIIGINNRNLKTLAIDLSTTDALCGQVPSDRLLISESGLHGRGDIRPLLGRVDGFLIGSALMKAPNLDLAVRDMLFGRVKVCGLTRPQDAQAAWAAGASYGGLIFYPRSPRAVNLSTAAEVISASPLRPVGVFVNESMDTVVEYAETLALHAVQLHGEESDAYIEQLRPRLNCEIWKASRIESTLPATLPPGVDRAVFDTYAKDARGGTGHRWNWDLLKTCPYRDQVILSGGLTPDLAQAADRTGVWALDVNSGVEDSPGLKSPARLQAFFAHLRGGVRAARPPM